MARRNRNGKQGRSETARPAAKPVRRKTSFGQRVLLVLLGLSLFAVLEIVLRIALPAEGPAADSDPFLGFSGINPLFESYRAADGSLWMKTASAKMRWFQRQEFEAEKPTGTFRIFSLGGSTTYGHPYLDRTSFSGWLRELLPLADPSRHYEVINAGGISYASYRVVIVLEEVLRYAPDLIVVYTGHNEFLESRTYGNLLEENTLVFRARAAASRLRTYRLLAGLYRRIEEGEGAGKAGQTAASGSILGAEVQTTLDRSAGLDLYIRDTTYSRQVFEHFRFNLDRMKKICREARVPIVFLDPVDNFKDFSPFKSQESATLDSRGRENLHNTISEGVRLIGESHLGEAVERFRQAVAIDSLYAHSWFYLGSALLVAGDTAAAAVDLVRARELDVCPLRAQEPIHQALREVTAGTDDPDLLDIPGLFRSLSPGGLVGRETLMDHIHPYPEGNLRIALEALAWMADEGFIDKRNLPDEAKAAEVFARVMNSLPDDYFRKGVINLAKVLIWAKKNSEALAVLDGNWKLIEKEAESYYLAGAAHQQRGEPEPALEYLRRARQMQPGHLMVLDRLARVYSSLGMADSAAAVYEELLELYPDQPGALADYASLLSLTGQTDRALEIIRRAQAIDPHMRGANNNLGLIYSTQKDYVKAIKAFRRELELSPDDPLARYNLGIAYSLNGELDNAERSFLESLQLNPQNAAARTDLGNLYQQTGRGELAEEQYRLALVLDPNQLAPYINLARLYRTIGRDSLCAEVAGRGLERFPGNAALAELAGGKTTATPPGSAK